jgi:DNA-binding response OmpR family regulator
LKEASINKKILILDDDEDILLYLSKILKKNKYEVEFTTDSKNFINHLLNFGPHLCLVDINLDEHEGLGFEIIKLIRRKVGPELLMVAMSRRDSYEDIEYALQCGANDYINKPIDDLTLLSKLNALFHRIHADETAMPYHAISASQGDCTFSFPLSIHSLTEKEIIIYSHHYIAKNTYIEVSGPIIDKLLSMGAKLKCPIKEVSKDPELSGYLLHAEIDETNDELQKRSRQLLLDLTPI